MRYVDLSRFALACGLMSILAACGGGAATTPATDDPVVPVPTVPTTPTTPTAPTNPGDQTGSEMRSGAVSLINTWAPTSTPTYTDLATIQTSGSATYTGYLYGDLSNTSDGVTDTLTGALELRAGFTAASATLTGTASNFVDDDDVALAGTLTISGGGLNRAGNPASDATLTTGASGTLTDSAGRTLDIGVQLEGDFLGSASGAIGGEALGGVTVGGVDQDFDGGFIVAN